LNTIVKKNIVFVLSLCLLISSCGPVATLAPAVTPAPASEQTKTAPPTIVSKPEITPAMPAQGFDQIDKLIDSDQAVLPFHPTDVFMFALPDWNSADGINVAKKLHATVIGSCHQDNEWRLQKWVDNADLLKKVVSIAHAAGLQYTTHYTVSRDNADFSIPFDEQVAVRDIDGNIIVESQPGENLRIWKSVHYPIWKEYMINLAKKAVDDGVDILCIDGWTFNYDVISKGGDFSANSLSGFREYLKNKYSQEQLQGFGISDISTFDYRKFKKSNATDPLMVDFEDFQLRSAKVFWEDIIRETRKYAEEQGKTVLFTVNVNIDSWEMVPGLPIANSVDGFMSEYRFQLPPYNNTITEFKIFRSMGKPVILIPNAGASAEFLQRTDLAEIMKIYTAEAYASGEFVYPPYSILASGPAGWQFYNADMNKLYPYYDFIAGNKAIYENLTSAADIAVLYSYASLKDKRNDNAYKNFYGISNLLLDAHRQYDVLFAGDTVWMADSLTMEQLNQYQAIILPNVGDISDRQLGLIIDYVKQGGKVFAFGDTGVRNELGQPVDQTRFGDLLVQGSHSYGQGLFEYVPHNLGTIYQSNNDAASRQKMLGDLRILGQGDIQTNADSSVSILEYWNTRLEAGIIQLINHDYDTQKQQINQQHNISMDISLNEQLRDNDLNVFYISPDWKDIKELKYSVADSKISFIIPDLDTYGIIYVGEKNTFMAELGNK
jgi:hypothetical protein